MAAWTSSCSSSPSSSGSTSALHEPPIAEALPTIPPRPFRMGQGRGEGTVLSLESVVSWPAGTFVESGMKRVLKLAISLVVRAWDILVAFALRLVGRRTQPTCVVIYYHAIDSGQRARFARQMDDLVRLAKPVPAGVSSLPDSPAHYCAITFDDGFVSVLENALPELELSRKSVV